MGERGGQQGVAAAAAKKICQRNRNWPNNGRKIMSAAAGRVVVDLLVVEMVVSAWNVGNTGDNEPLQLVPPRACVQDLRANDLVCTRSLGSPLSPDTVLLARASPEHQPALCCGCSTPRCLPLRSIAPLHDICLFAPGCAGRLGR